MTGLLTKESFFAALDRLDESEDEHNDRRDAVIPGHAMGNPKAQKLIPSSDHEPVSLSRNSGPQPSCDVESKSTELSTTLNPVSVNPQELTEIMPKSGGPPTKKRRINNVKLIPDDQKIFKGLVFCE